MAEIFLASSYTRVDMKENIDSRRSKRFTYLVLLLSALGWSWMFNLYIMDFARVSQYEGALARIIVGTRLFIPVWITSIIGYFVLERLLKLKKSNLFFLPLIIFAFPAVWQRARISTEQ